MILTQATSHPHAVSNRLPDSLRFSSLPHAGKNAFHAPLMTPRDVSSRFGNRLRDLRKAHNLTQLQMAIEFGIDRSYIPDVERGRKSVSLPTLEVIALGLNVSLSDLLQDI